MNNSVQRTVELTEQVKLELAACDDIRLGQPAPYDMLDCTGRLLLVKGKPITRLAAEMMNKQQVYVISRESSQQLAGRFSRSMHKRAVAIIERLYCNTPILNAEHLQEVAAVVDSLLVELKQKPQLYVDLRYLKNYDDFTYVHSVNVAILAALIGQGLGFPQQELRWLSLGAILHDIGKVRIPKKNPK